MHRKFVQQTRRTSAEQSLLQRVKVHYRSMRFKDKRRDSESDILLSADEELLDSEDAQLRSSKKSVIA